MRHLPISLIFSFLLAAAGLSGQSFFDLVNRATDGEAVDLELTLPVDSILAKVAGEQPATLSFVGGDRQEHRFALELSVRGKFRRGRCDFPPLKLNLSKRELRAAGLAEHDKLKLVTTCFADSLASRLLLKEYLAYRAYALLSPEAHFRTQLLRVTYHDAAGVHPSRTDYAFLIEDTDEMAARTGGRELEEAIGLGADRYDPAAEASHALFQYLVGNADWSLPLHRNVKVVERPDGALVPVGYDFDFSGWVGAPYASPRREIGQQSIYERVYLGFAQSERTLRDTYQQFRSQRRELLSLIDDFERLPATDRTILRRFVQRFYDDLSTMSGNTGVLLYRQLRGTAAALIPPGGEAASYRASARR